MTPFKIGSIYRNVEGELVRLAPMDIHYDDRRCLAMFPGESFALARSLANNDACGYIRLCNGLFVGRQVWEKDFYSLEYGELNAQGEPIAPTFYCAAETIKVDPTENIYAANPDEMTFEELMADFRQRQARTQTQPEKVRPPLDWADSKAADPFAGYVTTRDTATPDHAYSHPLTRVADAGAQTPPVCGSAWLVVR